MIKNLRDIIEPPKEEPAAEDESFDFKQLIHESSIMSRLKKSSVPPLSITCPIVIKPGSSNPDSTILERLKPSYSKETSLKG
jgi:hypothetical protein